MAKRVQERAEVAGRHQWVLEDPDCTNIPIARRLQKSHFLLVPRNGSFPVLGVKTDLHTKLFLGSKSC